MNVLIFDCFGVLAEEVAQAWYKKHVDEQTKNYLKEHYNIPADKGEISLEDMFIGFSNHSDQTIKSIEYAWVQERPLNHTLLDTIQNLKKTYRIVLLSNAPAGLVERVLGTEILTSHFDDVFISYALGLAKPEPEIYEHVLQELGVAAENCHFFDDSLVNVESARKLGIHTHHFINTEDCISYIAHIKNT